MKGLLEKLMPIERMISLAVKFGLFKKPLEVAGKAWKSAQGVKTQASLVLAGIIALAAMVGYIDWPTAENLIKVLVGVAGASMADKVSRALPILEQASEKIAEEGKKGE